MLDLDCYVSRVPVSQRLAVTQVRPNAKLYRHGDCKTNGEETIYIDGGSRIEEIAHHSFQ